MYHPRETHHPVDWTCFVVFPNLGPPPWRANESYTLSKQVSIECLGAWVSGCLGAEIGTQSLPRDWTEYLWAGGTTLGSQLAGTIHPVWIMKDATSLYVRLLLSFRPGEEPSRARANMKTIQVGVQKVTN
ncbi:hypothetical protein PG990_004935 [Apiospora arundinis]